MKFVLSRNKRPLNPLDGLPGDITDPKIYLDKSTAIKTATMLGCEIGIVVSPPYFAIDIDHALKDGKWSDLSLSLVSSFPGAYVERSRSGDGLHIIGKYNGTLEHRCKNIPLGIECYTENRLIVLTGTDHQGSWETDHTESLRSTVETYFKPRDHINSKAWTTGPCDEYTGSQDDDEILKKALESKSVNAAFGNRASFGDLWNRDIANLSKFYPDEKREFDYSSADLALCIHLAFWTGRDCERIERLFSKSKLVRDKWEKRKEYRHDTILEAVASCSGVYTAGNPLPEGDDIRHGFQYMSVDTQIEYFKDCVYIMDRHEIITGNGMEFNPVQFKALYGGYVFAIDSIDDKTSRNAWEVFTESQAYSFPAAHTTVFKPLEKPGAIIE